MIDTSNLSAFLERVQLAQSELKPFAARTLDEIGEEFLDMVQGEIQSNGHIVSGALAASFKKGGAGNIYQLDTGGLTLTIGSTVNYAKWVEKGHGQRPGRFIPGYWAGKRFVYDRGAPGGMVLKANFVKGSYFFTKACAQLRELFPTFTEKAFEHFFAMYFG